MAWTGILPAGYAFQGPVAFLTGDDARFVTGQTLVMDGGLMRL
jgi:NAD(P)-dependent dehydrogenase (short-subunit alcohol dehydrogenase family)